MNTSHRNIPSFIRLQLYVNLDNHLNACHLWLCHPSLFFRLQDVHELGELFEDVLSDHPFPFSLSISSLYVNLISCFKTFHSSQDVREQLTVNLANSLIWSSFPIFFRMYVNLVDCLNTSHLTIPSLPLHLSLACTRTWGQLFPLIWSSRPSSPGCMWSWSIVWRPLIWSLHHITFIPLQRVSVHDQLEDRSLIIPSHSLYPSPDSTWICCIVWRPLIRPFHPILFIRFQTVRGLGQLLEDFSSDHPIPLPSSFFRKYVKLINHLTTSYLIICPLHPSPVRTWTWPTVWRPFIWSSNLNDLNPSSISSEYVNLVNCLNRDHQFTPSLSLRPSPESMWTGCGLFEHLSFQPIFLIRLQQVREFGQIFFKDLSSEYPISSPSSISRKYVNLINHWRALIWSSIPFIRLQFVRVLDQYLKTSHLIILSHPFIRLQFVRDLVNCLNTYQLITQCLPRHPSSESTWSWRIVFECLSSDHLNPSSSAASSTWIWSILLGPLIRSSHPIPFIRLQIVCEFAPWFEDLLSDHPIPFSLSISSKYVNLWACTRAWCVNCKSTSSGPVVQSDYGWSDCSNVFLLIFAKVPDKRTPIGTSDYCSGYGAIMTPIRKKNCVLWERFMHNYKVILPWFPAISCGINHESSL